MGCSRTIHLFFKTLIMINKFTIALFVFFLPFLGYTQDKTDNPYLKGYINTDTPFTKSISLIDNDRDFPIIEVELNEKKHYFLFDTGSMISIVSDKVIDPTKINQENIIVIEQATNQGATSEAYLTQERIKIKDVEFEHIAMAVVNLEKINTLGCIKIDGIIGMNLIKLCNWKIDPFDQTISFSDQTFKSPNQDQGISLVYAQGLLPLIKVNQGKNNFQTLVDTGYDGTLQVFTDFKKSKKMSSKIGKGKYGAGINQVREGKVEEVLLEQVNLDHYKLTQVPTSILDEKPLLGMGILGQYVTIFNFNENKLVLVDHNSVPTYKNQTTWGGKFCLNENKEVEVCFIWEGSELEQADIKIGDQLISINNQTINQLTYAEFCELTASLKKLNKATFGFKTKKKEKLVDLNK